MTSWSAILAIYAIGVLGSMQVGRLATAADVLREELLLSLIQLGWLISLITVASAALGTAAGFWVTVTGPRRALLSGTFALAVFVVLAAMSTSAEMLLVFRALEGLGYLAIVIAAPTLMARYALGRDRDRALALWGTFFTTGLAMSAMAGGWITATLGWRSWFAANSLLLFFGLIVARMILPRDQSRAGVDRSDIKIAQRVSAASWLLGFGFFGIALIALAVLSLWPTYLVKEWSYTLEAAGNVTALTALASLGGSLVYGILDSSKGSMKVVTIACLAMIGGTWLAFGTTVSAEICIAGAAVVIVANGFLGAMVFAAVPRFARSEEFVGPANGIVTQLGSVGAMAGPPSIGLIVSAKGWIALVPLIVLCTLLSLVLIVGAEYVRRMETTCA